jgi:hypothetical protein
MQERQRRGNRGWTRVEARDGTLWGCMEYGQCGRYSRNEGVNSEEASESIIPSALVSRVRELVVQSHRYQEKLERLSAEIDHLNQRIARLNADLGSLRSEKEYLTK